MGFPETWKKITEILERENYDIAGQKITTPGGYIFKNKNGLPNVGLWIMPNNKEGGFLENFVKQSLAVSENKLFSYIDTVLKKLPETRFSELHLAKAEVATWMAWQKVPGQAMASAVSGGLIDMKTGVAKEFIVWLTKVYK